MGMKKAIFNCREYGDACTAVKVNQQYSVVDGCCIMCVHVSQVLSRAIQQCQANPQES